LKIIRNQTAEKVNKPDKEAEKVKKLDEEVKDEEVKAADAIG